MLPKFFGSLDYDYGPGTIIAAKVYSITKPSDRILIEFVANNGGGTNVHEICKVSYDTSTSIFSVLTKDILGNSFTVLLDPGSDDFTWVLKAYVAFDGFVEFA